MKQPKFILSKKIVIEQYNKVKQLADIISYSSKTNQEITRILEKDTDSLFSVHFVNELKHIQDKSRVIFLAQAWDQQQIKELVDMGIKQFIVDNESDLDMLITFLENKETKINLFLRIKLKENTIRTEKYFVFGINAETTNKRIKELRNNKNIEKLGIHFHRKTQNMAEWNLKYEIENILDKETIDNIDIINIGGGLPCEYANTNIKVLDSIIKKIKEFKKFLNNNNIGLIIEPGRFIAAPAIKLETEIIAIYENTIIVNASVYNSDMDAIIVPVKLLIENEIKKEDAIKEHILPYIIKGITPCSQDLFRYKAYLKDPKVGNKLTFLNAGAYNFTSDFCDLEKIETEIIE
jgi:ornithine decarboxylase